MATFIIGIKEDCGLEDKNSLIQGLLLLRSSGDSGDNGNLTTT